MCRELADGPVPMYTPTVRGGKTMSVGMLCLGKHWNGLTYAYEDASVRPRQPAVPPMPPMICRRSRARPPHDAGFEMGRISAS